MSTAEAARFAALGDPLRLAIVARLSASGPLPTNALRGAAPTTSRQGVTKHLRVLEQAGLVESGRAGRNREWRLQPDRLATMRAELDELAARWDARLARLRALVEG